MKLLSTLSALALISFQAQGANITLSGLVLPTLQDAGGNALDDGSVVQVGYLLGLSTGQDLSDAGNVANIDWTSFTALTGQGSENSTGDFDTRISSLFGSGTFFGENLVFDDADAIFAQGLPVRVAVRVYDSVSDITGAPYNTYTSATDAFILESPDALNPNAGRADFSINDVSDSGLIWQWDETPFQTGAIPEPSTILSSFLVIGMLLGRRRRN
jgi:hypothetical protein